MTLELSRAERDLLLFLLENVSDQTVMDKTLIEAMDPVDKINLHRDFSVWANPSNRTIALPGIPDYLWVGYMKSKIKAIK